MSDDNKTTDQITPGPWMVNKYGSVGAGQYGTLPIVAYVEALEGHDRKYGDHLANARLIAAAPDLLALAKQYLSECSECNGSGTTWDRDNCTHTIDCPDCADIRTVIAKAEGKAHV